MRSLQERKKLQTVVLFTALETVDAPWLFYRVSVIRYFVQTLGLSSDGIEMGMDLHSSDAKVVWNLVHLFYWET